MTWRNHALFTASLLWITGQAWPAIAVATMASTWPDRIEHVFGWRHRGVSHWPGLWLGLLGIAQLTPVPILRWGVLWFAVGSLTHILGDMLSKSGVPLLWPHRTVRGLGLFRVGSWREHAFIGVWLLFCLYGHLQGWFPIDL